MRPIVNSNFAKVLVGITIFITLGIGIFSMAAMQHKGDSGSSMATMSHAPGCSAPFESQSCLSFHLEMLQHFSQNLSTGGIGLGITVLVLCLALLLFAISDLFFDVNRFAGIFKVRLRQLLEDISTVFYDSLGRWLSMFEKRDSAHIFAFA
jgi:hypothetical protein